MRPFRAHRITVPAMLVLAALLGAAGAFAQPASPVYEVTIYNLTRSQVLSPPVVATHSRNMSLFELTQPAAADLALMAEDGDAGPLADRLAGMTPVRDVAIASGPIPPGSSASVTLTGGVPSTASARPACW